LRILRVMSDSKTSRIYISPQKEKLARCIACRRTAQRRLAAYSTNLSAQTLRLRRRESGLPSFRMRAEILVLLQSPGN